jgi:formyl-CoA transferase
MGLFENIKVLSLEQATVLPFLTYRLAQEGMEIIRLEHPKFGDPNRFIGENALNEKGMNSYFLPNNCGKKAVTLNLRSPEGQELLRKLIVELDIDVFACNQLPRNYPKLGIEYETLKKIKPDIIWIGITGFGPDSNEGAYDPILQARAGIMDLTGESDGDPQVFGVPIADLGTSEHAFGQIMKALYKRAVTGDGSRIDMSMLFSTVSWLVNPIMLTGDFHEKITRRGNTHQFFSPVSVYPTSDGYVYIAVGNDRQWGTFTEFPEFAHLKNPDYEKNAGRIADVTSLNQKIADVTKKFTTEEIIAKFTAATIPISKVNTMEDVVADPLIKDNMLTATDKRSGKTVHLPPPVVLTDYLKEANRQLSFPPRFGEHNEEVYGKLGYSADDLAKLKEKEII